MTTYSVKRSIEASPEVLWGLLTDASGYPDSQDDGTADFSMEEVYTGLMAPLITKSIPDMTDSFNQFADGLKAAAESRDG